MRTLLFLIAICFISGCSSNEFDNKIYRVDFAWIDPGDSSVAQMIKVGSDLNMVYRTNDTLCCQGKIEKSKWDNITKKINKIDLRYLPPSNPMFDDCSSIAFILYTREGQPREYYFSECAAAQEVLQLAEELKPLSNSRSFKCSSCGDAFNAFFEYFKMQGLKQLAPTPPPSMIAPAFPKSKGEQAKYDSSLKKVKDFEDGVK